MIEKSNLDIKTYLKVNVDGTMYGELPAGWEGVSAGFKRDTQALDIFENNTLALYTAASISNSDIIGIVDDQGMYIVDITDFEKGLLAQWDSGSKRMILKSNKDISGVLGAILLAGQGLLDGIERFVYNVKNSSALHQEVYDSLGFSNSIDVCEVGRGGGITGVEVIEASGNPGSYDLVYTAASKTLTFGGGTAVYAYIIPTTPSTYKLTLVASDGVTKLDVLVEPASFPVGNTTEKVGLALAKGTAVEQPTNVTGVTLICPTGLVCENTLAYVNTGTTLAWGGGTAVDVSDGGYFELEDTSGNTVIALVNASDLPSGNQTDADLRVSRCLINAGTESEALMINLLNA